MLPARRDMHSRPLFPAYLFVHCELEKVGIDNLQFIPGLRRIVSFGGRPAMVPDEAVSLIRQQLSSIEAQGGLPKHHFQPGDEVVINKGPLAGLRGVFQGPTGPAERVEILIRFLGQANRASVPVELLGDVSPDEDQIRRRRGTRGRGRHIRYGEQPRHTDPGSSKPDRGNSE